VSPTQSRFPFLLFEWFARLVVEDPARSMSSTDWPACYVTLCNRAPRRPSILSDPATLPAQIPPMVVQTLVENAIKYGMSRYPDPGEIVIAPSLTNSELTITITNNGQVEASGID
jgi:hypothetical protein